MKFRGLWTAVIAVGLGAAGCGGYGAICSDAMDCEGGNDNDVKACEIEAERREDRAKLAACDREFDDYRACLEDRSTCVDRKFSDRGYCDREEENLARCNDIFYRGR